MIGFPFKSTSRSIELALLISKEGKAGGGEFPVDMASIIQLPFSTEAKEEEKKEQVEKISLTLWLLVNLCKVHYKRYTVYYSIWTSWSGCKSFSSYCFYLGLQLCYSNQTLLTLDVRKCRRKMFLFPNSEHQCF